MNPDYQSVLNVIVLISMAVGLFGLVIPIFPGLVVIWASALGYGIAAGFGTLGWWMFGIITILMIAGSLIDNVFIGASAIQKGGSPWTVIIASIAGLIGSLVIPPLGGLIFSLAAAYLFEYYRHRDWKKALHLTQGMALGCGWAVVARFFMGLVMIGLWMVWAF